MPKTLIPTPPDPDLETLQRTLQRLGYGANLVAHGYPSAELWAAVGLFQMQHLGPKGLPLAADRVVGQDTWWALANPSGPRQRSGFTLAACARADLTQERQLLQDVVLGEYRKDVYESPDGSNRGTQIDTYWGNTGLLGKPWCCAFVSEMLFRAVGHYPLGRHHTSVLAMVQEAERLGRINRSPRPWDVWAQLHADGTGHTGFGSALDPNGITATFEGNCGNRLKHGRRELTTLTVWINPFGDKQAQVFQDLPELAELQAQATR